MAGTLSQADLVADLKAALHDAVDIFTAAADADFIRHLDVAALDLTRFRARQLIGTLTLTADQALYDLPADLIRPSLVLWGSEERRSRKPWQNNYPKQPPVMTVVESGSVKKLHLSPAPDAAEIAKLGSEYKFTYAARHVVAVAAADTTVAAADRDLLLLRARAEALLEISTHNTTKLATQAPGGSPARNATPMEIYKQLIAEFERRAKS